MKHVHSKMILGIVISIAFLLGSVATPVAALQVNMVEETFDYAFEPGDNNHTYVYVPPDPFYYYSSSSMYLSEDTLVTTYIYEDAGWSSPAWSISEDTNMLYGLQGNDIFTSGLFGCSATLPVFYDFIGADGSGAIINVTLEQRSFSLAFGQQTAVVMDTDYMYFGTLAISGQEFVHLTVDILQDDISWTVSVDDPEGRMMGSASGTEGDIVVIPFRPSTAGTYIVKLSATPGTGDLALFNFLPEAVAPMLLAPETIVTGNLPTGEFVVKDDTGSFVHDELRPTVHTYKLDPGVDVSSLTYAWNYPIPIFGFTQFPSIRITSDAFEYGLDGGNRYNFGIPAGPLTDVYHFRDGIHYVTVMGGDNTDYTLYHDGDVAEELLVNQEFFVENLDSHTSTNVYSLTVEEDSVIKVNSTSPSDLEITGWAVVDGEFRKSQFFVDAATIAASPLYYLPAGEYIFEVDIAMSTSEWIEFTVGPLTTDTSAGIVHIGGFIVDTDPGRQYNFTITLDNLYNVSAPMVVNTYDQTYSYVWGTSFTLGTWFDGSSQIPHSTHPSTMEYTQLTRIVSKDYAIVTVQVNPYNNTGGVGDDLENFAVNCTINWEDVTNDGFAGHANLDVTTQNDYEFTTELPGESVEWYSLNLTTVIGTWYNVSVIADAEVTALSNLRSYAPYDYATHYIAQSDLDDELVGLAPEWSFQFGAISEQMYLEIRVDRALVAEGDLLIEITPWNTTMYTPLAPPTAAGPDILATLGGIAVPLGISVVVIVVVVVVYVKKFKK